MNYFLKVTLAATILVGGAALPQELSAQRTTVVIRTAPPAPRVERVVVRRGYVWRPGFWRWNGRAYVWVAGQHYRARPGRTVWIAGQYRASNGGWVYVPGQWR